MGFDNSNLSAKVPERPGWATSDTPHGLFKHFLGLFT